jgi:hypothetical protein
MALGFLGLGFLGLHVRSDKKLSKEEKERKNVNNIGKDYSQTRLGAARGHQVGSLGHHGDKLDQLHHGQTGLPPNGKRLASFGHLGVHADKVVRVHAGVDESVQNNGQVNITIVVDVGVEPVKEKDGSVVVDVQEGKLSPLFANHDKKSVPKVPNLGGVKQPEEVGKRRVVWVIIVTRHEGVVVAVCQEKGLNGHVGTQHDLGNVVDKLDRVRVHRRNAHLHNGGPDQHKDEVANSDVPGRGKVRKGPSLE